METMPIWPPILALVLGAAGYLFVMWDSKRFDQRMERRKQARLKQEQTEH